MRSVPGLALLLCCIGLAQGAPSAAPYAHGLFWQITAPSGATAALVGSLHVDDSRVAAINQRALALLPGTRTLVEELAPDELLDPALMQAMFSGPPLSGQLPAADYAKALAQLQEHGLSAAQIQRMQLWAVWMQLELPLQSAPGLDVQLAQAAAKRGLPVLGLERVSEQLDALRQLPLPMQQSIVKDMVNHPQASQQALQDTIAAYAAQDLQRLYAQLDDDPETESLSAADQALLLQRVLWQRNQHMAERLQPLIEHGCALIAIGALHLPGVLTELAGHGYRVQPLPEVGMGCAADTTSSVNAAPAEKDKK